ncbi:unnamed protein product [Mycena citricolor]|uniref:Histone-lysine N-methyltransferase, H3 lysine-36 specific n=1 Tax=Mycena citricolor TaxID=2018698 RepID=A0AAD2K0N4_9AGAR|nr:unnamed protein product [Mycena citricolor]
MTKEDGPAREESALLSTSIAAESVSLPSPPMNPESEDGTAPLLPQAPSVVATKDDAPSNSDAERVPEDFTTNAREEDEAMPDALCSSSPSRASSKASSSSSPTPPPVKAATAANGRKKKPEAPVQLIGDLPIARDAALATFTVIEANNYQNKNLGRSREEMEGMSCECFFRRDVDPPHIACGPGSNCINRLTQIECLPGDCRCGSHCQNQRFQHKEYASIDIVQTEKKGFGLRVEEDIPKDTFIYEYVGDVVSPSSFKKRMRDYAEEGIQHFYFMMLQKDEFIDATKSGGIARFANHSCRPNCYVAKWTVGDHVRMGIFAKRRIQQYEELTFNYNVDRYGHKAQECYCGEENCVGYIGGKTQTDLVTVDDLYLDALGITDDDEVMALKGNKKKKGKKIDDADFMPQLRPIQIKEIPKLIQALRQTNSRTMIIKLLTRFRVTTEEETMREMLRLRCLSLMKNVLDDNGGDPEIVTLVLESMRTWPLAARNKVEDSQVNIAVDKIKESEDEKLKALAQDLSDHWDTLVMAYRIPRRAPVESDVQTSTSAHLFYQAPTYKKAALRQRSESPVSEHDWRSYKRSRDDSWPLDGYERPLYPSTKRREQSGRSQPERPSYQWQLVASQEDVKQVIAAAVAQKAAAELAAKESELAAAQARAEKKERREKRKQRSQEKKKKRTPEEREANKAQRLQKLIGAVVVKCMSKYGRGLERETFKKHAKELTTIIAEKEKKSSSYKDNKLEALSDEKVAKIKKFSKDYIVKVVKRMEEKNQKKKRSQHKASASSSSTATIATPAAGSMAETSDSLVATPVPDAMLDGDGEEAAEISMTVEEAMGLDPVGSDDDDDDTDTEDEDHGQDNNAIDNDQPAQGMLMDVDQNDADGDVDLHARPPELDAADGAI